MISVQAWRETVELPVFGTEKRATFTGPLTHSQITAELSTMGCRFNPVTLHQPPGQTALQVEATGVTFTFRTEAGSEPLLTTAGHWSNTHTCPPHPTHAPDDGFGA